MKFCNPFSDRFSALDLVPDLEKATEKKKRVYGSLLGLALFLEAGYSTHIFIDP